MSLDSPENRGKIANLFPNIASSDFTITSEQSGDYNCIGWAAEEDYQWWWPIQYPGFQVAYWPNGCTRQETVEAFTEAFSSIGYQACDDGKSEEGFIKLAIFCIGAKVTHMSRQLSTGEWASKLGGAWDIEHGTVESIEGAEYGKAVFFLKKSVR